MGWVPVTFSLGMRGQVNIRGKQNSEEHTVRVLLSANHSIGFFISMPQHFSTLRRTHRERDTFIAL